MQRANDDYYKFIHLSRTSILAHYLFIMMASCPLLGIIYFYQEKYQFAMDTDLGMYLIALTCLIFTYWDKYIGAYCFISSMKYVYLVKYLIYFDKSTDLFAGYIIYIWVGIFVYTWSLQFMGLGVEIYDCHSRMFR